MFAYSHPLINSGAGRNKTDPENERRVELVLDRYEEWSIKTKGSYSENRFSVTRTQAEKAKKIYPAAGFVVTRCSS